MNKKDKSFVYLLKDHNGNIKYIGQSVNPRLRFKTHLYEAANPEFCLSPNSHKNRWLRTLFKKNKEPILEIIEEVDYCEIDDRERYWIKYYKDLGCKLTNMSDGGKGWPKIFVNGGDLDMNLMKIKIFLYSKLKSQMGQGIKNYIESIYGYGYKDFLEKKNKTPGELRIANFIDMLKILKNPFTKMSEEEVDEIYDYYVMNEMFPDEFVDEIWEKIP